MYQYRIDESPQTAGRQVRPSTGTSDGEPMHSTLASVLHCIAAVEHIALYFSATLQLAGNASLRALCFVAHVCCGTMVCEHATYLGETKEMFPSRWHSGRVGADCAGIDT